MKIDDLAAFHVSEIDPLSPLRDVQARCRKRLAEEDLLVAGQEPHGVFTKVRLGPSPPLGRNVDVAFGAQKLGRDGMFKDIVLHAPPQWLLSIVIST